VKGQSHTARCKTAHKTSIVRRNSGRFFSNSCHFNAKLALPDENQGDVPIFAAKLPPFFVKQT
jgi:hypothetical protein